MHIHTPIAEDAVQSADLLIRSDSALPHRTAHNLSILSHSHNNGSASRRIFAIQYIAQGHLNMQPELVIETLIHRIKSSQMYYYLLLEYDLLFLLSDIQLTWLQLSTYLI